MVGWLKALLFVVGGVTAAAGTAYVTGLLDPLLGRNPPAIAALPETAAPEPAQPQEQPSATSDEPAAGTDEAAASDKQDRLVRPSFDVLRVEPDGSLLIAGKAAADAMVDVLNGDAVIGSADAGPEGDFVVVLDDPLAPGDYQLSLRSISGDIVIQSEESAVVSVPETPDGEVLALVDTPGAPAELITVPEGPAAPESEEEPQVAAAPAEQEQAPEEEEEAAAPATGEEPVAAADEAAPEEPAAEEDLAATEQPAAEEEAIAQPDAAETPAAPADEPAIASDTPDAAPEQDVAADDEPAQEESEGEIASLPEEQEPAAEPQQDASIAYRVVVEAVEIEDGTIYVAGQAIPGRVVRVYADETLLGQSIVSEGGRFLIEARRDLPVGSYMIRADLLEADGSVVARAAVPFEREPGEAIAAVAPQVEQQPAAPAPSADAPQETATEEGASEEVAAAPALQRVDRGVIIRRGDSLWRISRRVYGKGVRYSTIYLANQDQIRNPDLIWPGQVFNLPQTTPEGDLADLDAIADQMVAPEEDAARQ